MKKQNGELKIIKTSYYTFTKPKKIYKYFIVPNMAEFIRDITELGNVGALKKRLLKLTIFKLIKLIWLNKFNLIEIAKKDFAAGMLLLIETELLSLEKYEPEMIILSDQVTDLSLALQNSKIIKCFLDIVEKDFKLKAGLMTNNIPSLFKRLSAWKIIQPYIYAPINSYGYEMNPGKKIVEKYINMLDTNRIIAITPVLKLSDKKYLKKLNIKNVILN